MKTKNILFSVLALSVAAVSAWAVPEAFASLDEQTSSVTDMVVSLPQRQH